MTEHCTPMQCYSIVFGNQHTDATDVKKDVKCKFDYFHVYIVY